MSRTLVVFSLVIACGGDPAGQSFAGLARVSGQSLFPAGCEGNQGGTLFRGAEVEPFVAINPKDPKHLVGVWQQDRWSNGGANGLGSAVSFDGGNTWATTAAKFTTCSGGVFQRASDPWVTFAADGVPHHIGFGFNRVDAHQAMLAVRSADGGRTWSAPVFIVEETQNDVGIDKESITADPTNAAFVYAVWDRLTGVTTPTAPTNTGPAIFTRTTDGGATWEPPRVLYDPGQNAQTIGNVIAVLPDGTLLNATTVITEMNQPNSTATASVLRSTDKGVTWPERHNVAIEQALGVRDPITKKPVRTGDILPAIAVDPRAATSTVYLVWADARFTNARDGIAISKSVDGGVTWSAPAQVNAVTTTQAFTPAVAVAPDGKVGVLYYDLRAEQPSDGSALLVTAWLAVSSDGGTTWHESLAGGPFDIKTAALTGDGWFVGDYQGLVANPSGFLPFFGMTNNGNTANRSDIFARPTAAAASSILVATQEFSFAPTSRRGLRTAY